MTQTGIPNKLKGLKKGDLILNPDNKTQTFVSFEKGIGTDRICWIKVKETTTLQQVLNCDKKPK